MISDFMLIGYGQIVEKLAKEHDDSVAAVLQRMQRNHASDLLYLFREDCKNAQISVPSDDEIPELLKRLWDHYSG